ncbi:MAG: DUF2889 domain-containing protein [Sterolibacterium sp.]
MDSDNLGRELAHTRQITCKAYRRRDGLWEIEGSICDEKAQEVAFRTRPPVPAGATIHLMSLTLLVDNDYTIRDAQAKTSTAPWPDCGGTDASYRQLTGLRIEAGFRQQVRKLLGGPLGCTHLNDLIGVLANTYIQASWPDRVKRQSALSKNPRQWSDKGTLAFVGQCHALRQGGETLRNEYPKLTEDASQRDK